MPTPAFRPAAPRPAFAAALALLAPAALLPALAGCGGDRGGVVEQDMTAEEIRAETERVSARAEAEMAAGVGQDD